MEELICQTPLSLVFDNANLFPIRLTEQSLSCRYQSSISEPLQKIGSRGTLRSACALTVVTIAIAINTTRLIVMYCFAFIVFTPIFGFGFISPTQCCSARSFRRTMPVPVRRNGRAGRSVVSGRWEASCFPCPWSPSGRSRYPPNRQRSSSRSSCWSRCCSVSMLRMIGRRLQVIGGNGPEIANGHLSRHHQFVVLAAVQPLAVWRFPQCQGSTSRCRSSSRW